MRADRRTVAGLVGLVVLMAGCASQESATPGTAGTPETSTSSDADAGHEHEHEGHDHSGHDHSGHDHAPAGGPAPEGIAVAAAPSHPVGSQVVLRADHVPGMDGVEATVVGAFDTYTYEVD
ncbi:DUF1541 domain-containing protein [Kineococcus halophytocola]|uniref:DUF1541 domain-containing protein n=1 Tax=Kineococcus halophytocola TaxID=3234027 RepID=UPI003519DF05